MAIRGTYGHVRRAHRVDLVIRVAGKQYKAVGYQNIFFKKMPDGKYDYYARHLASSRERIESIKESKDMTFNFWGTIVTSEPIDFMGADERIVKVLSYKKCEDYDLGKSL